METSIPSPQMPGPLMSPKKPFFKSMIFILIIAVVLVILLVGVVVLFMRSSGSGKDGTANGTPTPTLHPDELVASVGEELIYKSTVQRIAQEQYASNAITDDVLRTFLDVAIERAILRREASVSGIVITGTNSQLEYYQKLREEVVKRQVESVSAYVISFWMPPFTDPQLPEFEGQRTDGKAALTEAENRIRAGEAPLTIARSLFDKYPSLQPILALNGYLLKSSIADTVYTSPRTYVYSPENKDQPFYKTLFSMKKGEIKNNTWEDGTGAALIHVISVNSSNNGSYTQWLESKKKELVKIHNAL